MTTCNIGLSFELLMYPGACIVTLMRDGKLSITLVGNKDSAGNQLIDRRFISTIDIETAHAIGEAFLAYSVKELL